ncbi:MAG: glycerol-3-phosphate dehydrogenase [Gemmatimonadetes bacterium]|nr:glycerol-3-phosphate dehydrogenase [Gemmatimonadota bacterium]
MKPPPRSEQLQALAAGDFDVLVIGGGISGVAVARDAALRGYRTALVEAADFASGTSSRSSRLVHGGLRYLEHFELDLVFEASQERRTLLRIAPHLVRPLEFLFPIFEEGRVGKRKLDAGMWLYDALALFRNIERHQMLEADELLEREPQLRRDGLLGGARYYDAQVDDARLVVTTAIAALEAGAVALNRARVRGIETAGWPGHRVRVEDEETGATIEADALTVVNATGAWAGRTLRLTDASRPVALSPSRGTHIHVPRGRVGHEGAFIFEAPEDGRIMFVLPWRDDLTLIGTTDDFHEGEPEDVAPTPGDIAYLLDATNRLFPAARLAAADVLSAWAGLRPLVAPAPDAGSDAGQVSREFEIHEDPKGLFTLSGGKLTSGRHMAEETVDRIERVLVEADVTRGRSCDTAKRPLPGGGFRVLDGLREGIRERAALHDVPPASADRLTRAYGTRADRVLDLVARRAELRHPILEGRPHVLAEAVYASTHELALHVEDVLYRRTRLGLESRDGIRGAAERVAAEMAPILGWSRAEAAREVDRAVAVRDRDDRAIEAVAS